MKKDRLYKKAEQRRRAAIHEILDLVMDINGLQESQGSIKGKHPTVFLYFYRPTGKVEVDVSTDGLDPNVGCDAEYTSPIYESGLLDRESTFDKTIQGLKTLKKDLSGGNRKEVHGEKTNTHLL